MYYYAREPFAPCVLSLDAGFPLINIEKGGLHSGFRSAAGVAEDVPRVLSMDGDLKALAKGATGHASEPYKAKNAVTALPSLLAALFPHGEYYGGGTYVHEIENGVSFGCGFAGLDNHLHGADEFMSLEQMLFTCRIYARTILALCGA